MAGFLPRSAPPAQDGYLSRLLDISPAPNTDYMSVLPLAIDRTTGDVRPALPGMARGFLQGLLDLMHGAGGDAPRPLSDSDIPYTDPRLTPDAMQTLGLMVGPEMIGPRAAADATSLASRSAGLYNPPVQPLRPFEADYPSGKWPGGPPADAAGRLTQDIDGRPLVARWVVGRNVVGGKDQAVPAAELDAVGRAATGRGFEAAPPREIGSDAGRLAVSPSTGLPLQIYLRSNLL
jgi:hypothetical protein